MEEIYNNHKLAIDYEKEPDILHVYWKKGCGNIVKNNHSHEIEKIHYGLDESGARNLLANLENCQYEISKYSGPWYEHTLFSMFEGLSLSRLAIVVPGNLFVHSFFEAAEARERTGAKVQYFSDKDKAHQWLL